MAQIPPLMTRQTTKRSNGRCWTRPFCSQRQGSIRHFLRGDVGRAKLSASPPELVEQFFCPAERRRTFYIYHTRKFWARPGSLRRQRLDIRLVAGRRVQASPAPCPSGPYRRRWTCPAAREPIVAATAADARDVMIEGESGILACSPPDFKPEYNASKRRLTWPNGTVATIFSRKSPTGCAVRSFIGRWPTSWPPGVTATPGTCLQFGLRLGVNPQFAIATTPRPTAVIRELVNNPTCVVIHGTTYENRANLASNFFRQVIKRLRGNAPRRQELMAQILDDVPGALWTRDDGRTRVIQPPPLYRLVVAIDPAATTGTTGIVVSGIGKVRGEVNGYVLEDCTTPRRGVAQTVGKHVAAYHKWGADPDRRRSQPRRRDGQTDHRNDARFGQRKVQERPGHAEIR